MRLFTNLTLFTLLLLPLFGVGQKQYAIPGLEKEVEIVVDRWGVSHIYAQTERDLFFAQGFNVARDRLFQLEVWRRQATGTVAEWLGPAELERDIGTRLFQFRGDMEAEMNYYHPRGATIIRAFVAGINAYIDWANAHPAVLPPEFTALDLQPQHWTPAVVISRHQGLLGNIEQELNYGRMVAQLGVDLTKELSWFHPNEPRLQLDPMITADALAEDILRLYNAYRKPLRYQPDHRRSGTKMEQTDGAYAQWQSGFREDLDDTEGSNNWAITGEHSSSGYPMLANDPHRTLATPSLRYITHLVGPGWNVIGGGEPAIPGISIGHNEHGAWGLTVFRTDAEDLYVYETKADDPLQYRYQNSWEKMRRIPDTIRVRGQAPVIVNHYYTRHGPVVFQDSSRQLAYAVRCGWQEIGGAPYLVSLRMDQARNFEEFREACNYSHIPGENMVWADREGNIGWQAVGIAPIRRNWSGLVPVPGNGDYEWDGYLPMKQRPHSYNPPSGMIITANENVTPRDYPHPEALGFNWSDPYRGDRVAELLGEGRKHNLADFARYQTDYLSIPARTLVPYLQNVRNSDQRTETARQLLLNWDYFLDENSVAAAIYVAWERELHQQLIAQYQLKEDDFNLRVPLKQAIDWLIVPDGRFGSNPVQDRNLFLIDALQAAVEQLSQRLGDNMDAWVYGQAGYKHVYLQHAFTNGLPKALADSLAVGPAPRGGYAYTANSTGSNNQQSSGATFRILMDLADWDLTLACNAPGQSGNPRSQHYQDLFELWATNQYFPLFYSREKIETVGAERIVLQGK